MTQQCILCALPGDLRILSHKSGPCECGCGITRRCTVTLCGSIRFRDEMLRMAEILTLQGHIVLNVGCYHHEWLHLPANNGELQKDGLDALHKDKIRVSCSIYVVCPKWYIGRSTASEIAYAESLGRRIVYVPVVPAVSSVIRGHP